MDVRGARDFPLLEHRRMPPGEPIPPEHLEGFNAVRDAVMARLTPHAPSAQLAARARE